MTFGKLNSYNLISISGSDATTFLQGQLTNDVSLLNENPQWQYSGYCNPKGRLLALLQLWKMDEQEFYALLSNDLTELVLKRLRQYVMRSKVNIETLNKKIIGFNCVDSLSDYFTNNMSQINLTRAKSVSITHNNQCVLKIADQYILIDEDIESMQSFDSYWRALNIANGLPQITADSTELFIPQMINLDLLDGINFKKGCYTGQEIVARMHYLGNLKQRMFVCQSHDHRAKVKVNTGDKIFVGSDGNKTVGTIVSTSESSDKLLAVLKLANINGDLYLENGLKIKTIETQPYTIPIEK